MRRKDLMAKALGITTSVNKKSREERSIKPTGLFGEDYNRLREATLEAFPHIKPLLPPLVTFYDGGNRTQWTHQSFSEIDTFAEQIYQLLAEQED